MDNISVPGVNRTINLKFAVFKKYGLADARQKAYRAMVYLAFEPQRINIKFLVATTRAAPSFPYILGEKTIYPAR